MLDWSRVCFVLLVAALSGCSTMEIATDFDPQASFAGLKTYDWMPVPEETTEDLAAVSRNSLLEQRVFRAVERELGAKGYVRDSSGKADFLVGYHATLDSKTSVTVLDNYYHYQPYGWSRIPQTYVYEYEEGTLILDIVDAETRRLIWRGSARDEVSFSATPEQKEQKINEAVQRMLLTFPPK